MTDFSGHAISLPCRWRQEGW